MKSLLELISAEMIAQAEFVYSDAQVEARWFGNEGASQEVIQEAEARLQVTLPEDYKEFLSIANGFHAFSYVDPSFHAVDEIDFLQNKDPDLIHIWRETGNIETAQLMATSILVGGFQEEQAFLLIPPSVTTAHWRYWKFAAWIPGEESYSSLRHYFTDVLASLREDSAAA